MDASHDMSPQWFTSPAKRHLPLSLVARTTYTQNSLFSLTKKTLLPCIDPSEQGHSSADKRSEQQTMSHCTALQEKQMSHTKCKGWRFAHSDSTNVNDKTATTFWVARTWMLSQSKQPDDVAVSLVAPICTVCHC